MSAASKKQLKNCGEKVKPSRTLDCALYLKHCYSFLKAEVENYTYLQFAEDLGFSRTNVLHLIIRGRRRLSPKAANRIATAFELTAAERHYLDCLARHNSARKPEDREKHFAQLMEIKSRQISETVTQDRLGYYTEWYHPVIRELVGVRCIRKDDLSFVECIQPRVLPEQGRKSIELLEKLGLIRFDADADMYVQTSQNVSTGDEVLGLAVIHYHKEVMDLAKDAITTVKPRRRDISALTVAVDDSTAQKLKSEIQLFRKRLLAIADECTEPDQIYQLNFQLFPFTK